MTPVHTYAIPPTSSGRTPPERATGRKRATVTAAVLTAFALVVLFFTAVPSTVTTPVLVILATAVIVGGLFRMIAHVTRPIPAPDPVARRDA